MVTFEHGRWTGVTARAERELFKPEGDVARFDLPPDEQSGTPPLSRAGLTDWRIVPVKPVAGPLPVPPGTVELESVMEEVELDPFDGVVADIPSVYRAVAAGRPGRGLSRLRPPHDSQQFPVTYQQLPGEMRDPLLSFAKRVIPENVSPGEAARFLESYLAENGRYDPAAEHSRRQPIVHFLEGDLAGHCEYFATSLALTLRAINIPTRYVIGYRAQERNPVGDYLIVRDRDAHAWVEVYLDGEWHTFDPTPPGEQLAAHPDGFNTSYLRAVWDYGKHLLNKLMRGIAEGTWESLRERFLLWTLPVLLGLFFYLGFRYRKILGSFLMSPERTKLQALSGKVYRELALRGYRRAPSETASQFASRVRIDGLEKVADWLERYAVMRFGGYGERQLQTLENDLKHILGQKNFE
jgi:hypothetical protein